MYDGKQHIQIEVGGFKSEQRIQLPTWDVNDCGTWCLLFAVWCVPVFGILGFAFRLFMWAAGL